jgi:hypothetical protein
VSRRTQSISSSSSVIKTLSCHAEYKGTCPVGVDFLTVRSRGGGTGEKRAGWGFGHLPIRGCGQGASCATAANAIVQRAQSMARFDSQSSIHIDLRMLFQLPDFVYRVTSHVTVCYIIAPACPAVLMIDWVPGRRYVSGGSITSLLSNFGTFEESLVRK